MRLVGTATYSNITCLQPVDVDLSSMKIDKATDMKYPFSNDFSGYSTILYGEGVYAVNFMYVLIINKHMSTSNSFMKP